MKQVLVLILCVAYSAAQVQLCPQQSKANFLNTLETDCTNALNRLEFVPPPPPNLTTTALPPLELTPISEADLDVACQPSCQGNYSTWLRTSCGDPYTARSIDAMCECTAETNTNDIGSRCRYAFPDAFDARLLFRQIFFNCNFSLPDACVDNINSDPDSTNTEMTGDSQTGDPDSTPDFDVCGSFRALIDPLGSCYSSLYNNSEFLTFFSASGMLNETMAATTLVLGMSPVWDLCMIDVPEICDSAPPSTHIAFSGLALAVISSLFFLI